MPEFEIPAGNEFLNQEMDYESWLSFLEKVLINNKGHNFQTEKDDDYSDYGHNFQEQETDFAVEEEGEILVYNRLKDSDPIPEVINANYLFNDMYNRMVNLNLAPILPQPNVVVDNDITSVAVYHGMGLINIRENVKQGSRALTYGDALSIIYHEYNHFISDAKKSFPLSRDSDGVIVQWETDEILTYTRTDFDIKRDEDEAWEMVEKIYPDSPQEFKQRKFEEFNIGNTKTLTVPFRYAPSNLALDELNAYGTQLEGELLGLYELSDEYRQEIKSRINTFEQIYQRRVKYENDYNFNPDGTKK